MCNDSEGFSVPQIDQTRCTDCGICENKCPENVRPAFIENSCTKAFGARHKDDALRIKSASGGVFAGIAINILKNYNGAVFGCAFDNNIVARHICITDAKDIGLLQSSKYVQSDVSDTYLQAKNLLEQGKTVFYTGCPCQIAGLYAFLGKNYDNLLTADLICHGVPSPLLFKRYLGWLGKKLGGNVIYYNFRHKQKNEQGSFIMAKTKTKTKIIPKPNDVHYNAFNAARTLRESCYSCKYASANRVGDITLGDFWGIKDIHPEFRDSREAMSIVLVNNEKGERFVKEIYNEFYVVDSIVSKVLKSQRSLYVPKPRPELRDTAYAHINNETVNIFKEAAFKLSTKAVLKKYIPPFILKAFRAVKRKLKN